MQADSSSVERKLHRKHLDDLQHRPLALVELAGLRMATAVTAAVANLVLQAHMDE